MTPHVYGGSQVLGHTLYHEGTPPRHTYQHSDTSLYQTHPGTHLTGYTTNPQYIPHNIGSRGTSVGVPLQRSLSSSPGPYMSSSFPVHTPMPPLVTQSTAIFGQQPHPSYTTGSMLGSGYVTTPTYGPQYPGQPGQRYDLSQHYGAGTVGFFTGPGGYGMMTPSSSSQGANPGSQQSGVPPTGQVQRRHSPPDPRGGDPRYGNQGQ